MSGGAGFYTTGADGFAGPLTRDALSDLKKESSKLRVEYLNDHAEMAALIVSMVDAALNQQKQLDGFRRTVMFLSLAFVLEGAAIVTMATTLLSTP